MGTLSDHFTQTLITIDDIELLIKGGTPNKKLIVEASDYSDNAVARGRDTQLVRKTDRIRRGIGYERISKETHSIDEDKTPEQHVNDIADISVAQGSKTVQSKYIATRNQKTRGKGARKRKGKLKLKNNSTYRSRPIQPYSEGQQLQECNRCWPGGDTGLESSSKNIKTKCDSEKDGDESTKFKCLSCCKKFSSSKGLRTHSWIHERSKDYSCETCGKTFLRSHELRLHVRVHTGEKPFSCQFCKRSFTNSSALKRHQLVHRKEKNVSDLDKIHQCPHCGKAFSQKGNLTVHLKIHTGTYDHVCSTCEKSFITSGDLKRHLRVHSKERPYTCNSCGKSFTTSSSLVCHMRSHSGERPYLCGVCGASFSILGHLKQHNRIHARGNIWPRKKGTPTNNRCPPGGKSRDVSKRTPTEEKEGHIATTFEDSGINWGKSQRHSFSVQQRTTKIFLEPSQKNTVCSDLPSGKTIVPSQIVYQAGRSLSPAQISMTESPAVGSVVYVQSAEKLDGHVTKTHTGASANPTSMNYTRNMDNIIIGRLSDSQLLQGDKHSGNGTTSCDLAEIPFITATSVQDGHSCDNGVINIITTSTSESLKSQYPDSLNAKSTLHVSCPADTFDMNPVSLSTNTNVAVQKIDGDISEQSIGTSCQVTAGIQFSIPIQASQTYSCTSEMGRKSGGALLINSNNGSKVAITECNPGAISSVARPTTSYVAQSVNNSSSIINPVILSNKLSAISTSLHKAPGFMSEEIHKPQIDSKGHFIQASHMLPVYQSHNSHVLSVASIVPGCKSESVQEGRAFTSVSLRSSGECVSGDQDNTGSQCHQNASVLQDQTQFMSATAPSQPVSLHQTFSFVNQQESFPIAQFSSACLTSGDTHDESVSSMSQPSVPVPQQNTRMVLNSTQAARMVMLAAHDTSLTSPVIVCTSHSDK